MSNHKCPKEYLGKIVPVVIDRPIKSKHPKHDFIYELNYGYVPNTMSGDGEELDVYVLGEEEPIKEMKGKCFAIIHRDDDDDDKLVVAATDKIDYTDEEILSLTSFQEKFFKSRVIRL